MGFDIHSAREELWKAMVLYLESGGNVGQIIQMIEPAGAEYNRLRAVKAKMRREEEQAIESMQNEGGK